MNSISQGEGYEEGEIVEAAEDSGFITLRNKNFGSNSFVEWLKLPIDGWFEVIFEEDISCV